MGWLLMGTDHNTYWLTLRNLYGLAQELSPSEQILFAEENCSDPQMKKELLDLLHADESSIHFFDSLTNSLIKPAFEELSDLPPHSGNVNNYKLIRKIGRGGMGSVYLAERNDEAFTNRVAVKILRRGLDTDDILARFESERQILAQLNHPNITHLLDGGITCDGRPYFVMEYVEGKPINRYCDDNKLDLNERLNLFFQICDALSYAHQNLVIHRDLKPGNILVTKNGFVKLLDFGIAKLLDDNFQHPITISQTGIRLMTPEYASPEQVSGKPMNTTSDIFQLGLVLYNLLTGCTTFSFKNKSLIETERVILDQQALKPSQKVNGLSHLRRKKVSANRNTGPEKLISDLKGDLDTIVMNALQNDPAKRFQSVVEFKEEIERYLDGLPIRSKRQNFSYRTLKFIKRNQLPVATVSIFVATLISFFIFYNLSITEQRNEAQKEALKAAQVTSFLMDLFEANDPTQFQGENLTAWQLLEQGEERIQLLEGQPEVQAQMFEVTGQIYRKIGQYERSEELLHHALEIRKEVLGHHHNETIDIYNELGLLYSDLGNFSMADSLLRLALNIQMESGSQYPGTLSETQFNLAYILRRMGNYNEAEELYRRSYELRHRTFGQNHQNTIASMSSLGVTLLNKGNYTESEKIFRDVLELRRELIGPIHPDLAMSMNNLGASLLMIGRFKEAESLFRESLNMRTQLLGNMHPKTALTMNNLGISQMEQGLYADAEETIQNALSIRTAVLGDDNINTAISKFSLGELYLHTSRATEAGEILREAYTVFLERLSENHSFTARTKMAIGMSYLALNEPEHAEDYILKGFQNLQEIHRETSLEKALGIREYATFMQKTGNYVRADELYTEALEMLTEIEGPESERQQKIEHLKASLPQ